MAGSLRRKYLFFLLVLLLPSLAFAQVHVTSNQKGEYVEVGWEDYTSTTKLNMLSTGQTPSAEDLDLIGAYHAIGSAAQGVSNEPVLPYLDNQSSGDVRLNIYSFESGNYYIGANLLTIGGWKDEGFHLYAVDNPSHHLLAYGVYNGDYYYYSDSGGNKIDATLVSGDMYRDGKKDCPVFVGENHRNVSYVCNYSSFTNPVTMWSIPGADVIDIGKPINLTAEYDVMECGYAVPVLSEASLSIWTENQCDDFASKTNEIPVDNGYVYPLYSDATFDSSDSISGLTNWDDNVYTQPEAGELIGDDLLLKYNGDLYQWDLNDEAGQSSFDMAQIDTDTVPSCLGHSASKAPGTNISAFYNGEPVLVSGGEEVLDSATSGDICIDSSFDPYTALWDRFYQSGSSYDFDVWANGTGSWEKVSVSSDGADISSLTDSRCIRVETTDPDALSFIETAEDVDVTYDSRSPSLSTNTFKNYDFEKMDVVTEDAAEWTQSGNAYRIFTDEYEGYASMSIGGGDGDWIAQADVEIPTHSTAVWDFYYKAPSSVNLQIRTQGYGEMETLSLPSSSDWNHFIYESEVYKGYSGGSLNFYLDPDSDVKIDDIHMSFEKAAKDVRVENTSAEPSAVSEGEKFTAVAWLKNYGTDTATVDVTHHLLSGGLYDYYSSSVTPSITLDPNETARVTRDMFAPYNEHTHSTSYDVTAGVNGGAASGTGTLDVDNTVDLITSVASANPNEPYVGQNMNTTFFIESNKQGGDFKLNLSIGEEGNFWCGSDCYTYNYVSTTYVPISLGAEEHDSKKREFRVGSQFTVNKSYDLRMVIYDDSSVANLPHGIPVGVTEVYPDEFTPRENEPPVADADGPYSAKAGEDITFDGSGSHDPDGSITYEWEFGNDGTATGEIATYAYSAAGNYTVTLTVTDNKGATSSDTTWANITAVPVAATIRNVFMVETGTSCNYYKRIHGVTNNQMVKVCISFQNTGTVEYNYTIGVSIGNNETNTWVNEKYYKDGRGPWIYHHLRPKERVTVHRKMKIPSSSPNFFEPNKSYDIYSTIRKEPEGDVLDGYTAEDYIKVVTGRTWIDYVGEQINQQMGHFGDLMTEYVLTTPSRKIMAHGIMTVIFVAAFSFFAGALGGLAGFVFAQGVGYQLFLKDVSPFLGVILLLMGAGMLAVGIRQIFAGRR